jgi:hypothetical protein
MVNNYKYWKRYKSEELEATIKDNPITEEKLLNFISNSHIGVSYPFSSSINIGISCYHGCNNGRPCYDIDLCYTSTHEEQIETFSHELVHIFYGCGFSADGKEGLSIEDIIDRESVKLLSNHKNMVISILDSLPRFFFQSDSYNHEQQVQWL